MKRAVILHGTDSNPEVNWFPWLKQKLEASGYEVWVPLLPENHAPNRKVYGDFLFNADWDFTDNILIGHSSGAVEVLNLLMDARCPHIMLGVMVGAWEHGVPPGMDATQFEHLFPENGFDHELIRSKADKLTFLHGDDDPYCPLEQARALAHKLDAELTVVPKGHHLGSRFATLPEMLKVVEHLL